MKFKFKLPKFFKLPSFRKPTVDDVLKGAQYATYGFIVVRIIMYIVQQLKKVRFFRKG